MATGKARASTANGQLEEVKSGDVKPRLVLVALLSTAFLVHFNAPQRLDVAGFGCVPATYEAQLIPVAILGLVFIVNAS